MDDITSTLRVDAGRLQEELTKQKGRLHSDKAKYYQDRLKEVQTAQKEAADGTACSFWVLSVKELVNNATQLTNSGMLTLQELQVRFPNMLHMLRLTAREALTGGFKNDIMAVSHRWETEQNPDPKGPPRRSELPPLPVHQQRRACSQGRSSPKFSTMSVPTRACSTSGGITRACRSRHLTEHAREPSSASSTSCGTTSPSSLGVCRRCCCGTACASQP